MRLESSELYTIGWITALHIERAAATAFLDDVHESPERFQQNASDQNSYTWGRMGKHNIVIVSLPEGADGTAAAATTTSKLLSSLPQIRIGLLVGIGGGVAQPHKGQDIRLGDIVVGKPEGKYGGVVQYDHGKALRGPAWQRSRCKDCDQSQEIKRVEREDADPRIHYGLIASGNTVVKDAVFRDEISEVIGQGCMCFEMEAAGLMDSFPCLVIRGICDYADSHKNDRWQRYAAATAAAFAKELLGYVPTAQLNATQRAIELLSSIDSSVKNIESCSRQTNENVKMALDDVHERNQKQLLDRLPVVEDAAFDSHAEEHNRTCLKDTRVDVLQDIATWAVSSGTQQIFWLCGMAGTGKSTISRTIARSFAKQGILGASFFFKRGEGDRGNSSKVITTIAAQVAEKYPAISPLVAKALENDSRIVHKALREQFQELILKPLQTNSQHVRKNSDPIVIVIDALDECDSADDIELLIFLFSRTEGLQSVRLKTFVTSRPELSTRQTFSQMSGKYNDLVLHTIPQPVVETDISLFLHHEIKEIRDKYNASVSNHRCLATDWPGQSTIRTLIKMAVPLFIFAATICRFLNDRRCGNPDKQLEEILRFETRSQESQLDATYLPVLDQLWNGLSKRQRKNMLEQFRLIIGSIINLASPLSISSLSALLDVPRADINDKLDLLHSVLSIPPSEDKPIRLLHLSFRDFLLDPDKQNRNDFWVNEKQAHSVIATNCLRVMDCLRQDSCDIKDVGTHQSTISRRRIDDCLASEVQYACQYWVHHTQEAGTYAPDSGIVYRFLTQHFLHWLEALSLLGKVSRSIDFLNVLKSVFKATLLDDGLRFLLVNIECIRSTPLQLYSSLVVFAPQNSKVRALFENEIPGWILLKPKTDGDWTPCLQTLEGVNKAVFSHDSTLVASLGNNEKILVQRVNTSECVQVWNTQFGNESSSSVVLISFSHDGELLLTVSTAGTVRAWRTLPGGDDWPQRPFFSHDSLLLITVHRETIRTWRIDTGECIQKVYVHDLESWDSVSWDLATLSHDARLLACPAKRGGKINIWCAKTWKLRRVLLCHMDERVVTSPLAFSHDSAQLASGSNDGSIRVWSVNTGECMRILNGHLEPIFWVAFSHDSTMILSISTPLDTILRIWHTNSSERVQVLEHHKGQVLGLIFSPDSRLIVTKAIRDTHILVWNTENGESHALRGHQALIRSAVFSPDSALLASASDDAICIWRATTGECIHTLQGHGSSLCFSHDSKLLASGSRDGTIQTWHTDKGQCMHTLQGLPNRRYIGNIARLVFSNDSTLLVSSDCESVLSWRVDTGKFKDVLETGGRWPAIALSHDSQLVAISKKQSGNAIIIRRLNAGKCVHSFPIGDGDIGQLIFSHDSRLLAAMSRDGTARIWHINTGECVQYFHVGTRTTMLSFGRDSRQLITDHGTFMLQGMSPMRRGLLDSVECSIRAQETPYSVGEDRSWVEFNGQKLLWLPVDYRPGCWAVSKSTIVWGCPSGKVFLIRDFWDATIKSSSHKDPHLLKGKLTRDSSFLLP
ncbi:phosphorylase, AAA and WD40 domain protein [Metarhizium robertsii]|uniref:Phosphorylase, AAA and WD40 domain protein n=1 Tax=Metarhizium robertsii TaxID=568076 RepID=A0A0A1UR74_9HYPO|nr:phosphorylase, AAA and WD40 domain protein [Metarhizium robertsii]